MIPQDGLDPQTWFTRRAQAYDQEQRKMTDYTPRGCSLKPKTAYTVQMRRSAGSSPVHLSLSKKGDTWEIMGLNRCSETSDSSADAGFDRDEVFAVDNVDDFQAETSDRDMTHSPKPFFCSELFSHWSPRLASRCRADRRAGKKW